MSEKTARMTVDKIISDMERQEFVFCGIGYRGGVSGGLFVSKALLAQITPAGRAALKES